MCGFGLGTTRGLVRQSPSMKCNNLAKVEETMVQ